MNTGYRTSTEDLVDDALDLLQNNVPYLISKLREHRDKYEIKSKQTLMIQYRIILKNILIRQLSWNESDKLILAVTDDRVSRMLDYVAKEAW